MSFRYPNGAQVFEKFTLRIPPGQKVGLVGRSGGGKSTVFALLQRFYDVQHGSIAIDGQDLRDVQQSSLRAAIGIVPQDTVLFNDTLYYNIAYGRPGATRAEVDAAVIARAAKAKNLSEMVEAVLALCDCPAEVTGRITVSLDLIAEWGLTVHGLDGAPPG